MIFSHDILGKIRRALKKDPRYLVRRIWHEASIEAERYFGQRRARGLDIDALARSSGCGDIDSLWQRLHERTYAHPLLKDTAGLERLQPDACSELMSRARRALKNEVEMLGSGRVCLPSPIDWHADIKTGMRWEPAFHRDIDYNNLDEPSDVKLAWELSRLQWALPLGQAWLLKRDAECAEKARDLLEQWIAANPYGFSVNWACTMEPALRILSWTWLFHACADSPSWSDSTFRQIFLRSLYLHGDFVNRNLERADINGNHYIANAAGLVYAGFFFGNVGEAPSWAEKGWEILKEQLPLQVFPDGVDYEASVAYHRLVLELFFYPALYRLRQGLEVPSDYRQRLIAMANYVAAYSRFDGSIPLWGDADDGRALAFGIQSLNDHRYLIGLLAEIFCDQKLRENFSGPRDEIAWIAGLEVAEKLPSRKESMAMPSQAFCNGGFYILRSGKSHVFIDCGPLGLAGRGGHGHNDLLSFEAMLDGAHLISDCGSYLYTASPEERNRFRSTASHNTPQIDNEEINRFVKPDYLWVLHNDASFEIREWNIGSESSVLECEHNGYTRAGNSVIVRRRFELHHHTPLLAIHDQIISAADCNIRIPYHLAAGVTAYKKNNEVILESQGRKFELTWSSASEWSVSIEPIRISPSYGVVNSAWSVVFMVRGKLPLLRVKIAPSIV